MNEPVLISETDRWFVVSKPAGWLTIPGRGSDERPVLLEWVEKRLAAKAWVVHRIDLETSGVVLFAKTAEAHREAGGWFENQKVKKAYDFLSSGIPSLPLMKAKDPIEGKPSQTQIEVKKKFNAGFLGRAVPLSGRRHQIRIHLSKLGYPILGDTDYRGLTRVLGANTEKPVEISRVALHAASLELPTGEKFEAPWPSDFKTWVSLL